MSSTFVQTTTEAPERHAATTPDAGVRTAVLNQPVSGEGGSDRWVGAQSASSRMRIAALLAGAVLILFCVLLGTRVLWPAAETVTTSATSATVGNGP